MSKKVLLHTCCVSCLSYVSKKLAEKDFVPIVFFYNPSIHGKVEYLNRLKDVKTFCLENKLELVVPDYDEREFFSPIEPWLDSKSI